MRAKIASRASGHAFEKRFLSLSDEQLIVLYEQAVREEKEEFDDTLALNKLWKKRLDTLVDKLCMFSDVDLYKAWLKEKDLQELREEIKVEEFPQIWENMMKFLPSEIVVEEDTSSPLDAVSQADSEIEDIYAGIVSYKAQKEGEA